MKLLLVFIESTVRYNLLYNFFFLQDGEVLNFLQPQEADPSEQPDRPGYGHYQQPLLSSFDDAEEDEFRTDIWSAGGQHHSYTNPPFGTDVQEVKTLACTKPVNFTQFACFTYSTPRELHAFQPLHYTYITAVL